MRYEVVEVVSGARCAVDLALPAAYLLRDSLQAESLEKMNTRRYAIRCAGDLA
jgi:hypothetical protein